MNTEQSAIVARHLSSTCANKDSDGRSCHCATEYMTAGQQTELDVWS